MSAYGKTFVYCIRSGKYYKIGITNNIDNRLSMINSCNPGFIELIAFMEFTTRYLARKYESMLHKHYKNYNVKGEWFLLSDEDIETSFGGYRCPQNIG